MDETLKPVLAGVARHALTAAGGMLVAHGYMASGDTAAFVGGGMVVASVLWSWWQKDGQNKMIALMAKMKPVADPNDSTAIAVKKAQEAAK